MTLNEIAKVSIDRSNRWHTNGIVDWSTLEWSAAMAGEAGETCNAAKKLKRLEGKMVSKNDGVQHFDTIEEAKLQVCKEAADTILYAVLVMARVGITDVESVVRHVFNKKSLEYNFPEVL